MAMRHPATLAWAVPADGRKSPSAPAQRAQPSPVLRAAQPSPMLRVVSNDGRSSPSAGAPRAMLSPLLQAARPPPAEAVPSMAAQVRAISRAAASPVQVAAPRCAAPVATPVSSTYMLRPTGAHKQNSSDLLLAAPKVPNRGSPVSPASPARASAGRASPPAPAAMPAPLTPSHGRSTPPPRGGVEDESKDLQQLFLAVRNPVALRHFAGMMFRRYDADRNKKLSLFELERLLPALHRELGLIVSDSGPDYRRQVRARMRKFDKSGDGMLDEAEFAELYRWALWRRFEDVHPPKFRRGDTMNEARRGTPQQFYTLGKQLGSGSFGVVHKVTQTSSGLERVMKTINKDNAISSGTPLGMLKQEIDMLCLLDHPNILRLFEWYNDSQNVYLILDACSGGELLDLISDSAEKQWPLPEAWLERIFFQSLEAIGYCHSKGVMHKDLKFENIMLQKRLTAGSRLEDVEAVVIDVGLAELFGPQHGKQSRSNQRAGSLATMAPEVLMGDFSYKCDIWSLGCMIFAVYNSQPFNIPAPNGGEMLYMYPFFPQATNEDPMGVNSMLAVQKQGPPMQLLQTSNPALLELVSAMLQFQEQQRPDAATCLTSSWFGGAQSPVDGVLEGSAGRGALRFAKEQLFGLLAERESRLCWRAALLQAASQLPAAKIQPLARLFHEMDVDKSGFLDQCELVAGLRRLGVSDEAAQQAAAAADFDGNGKIEYTEFVAGCLPVASELFAVSLQAAFQAFDSDNDGAIDSTELSALLQSGQISGADMPQSKAVESMLAELDSDHNGRISFPEFHDYFIHADANFRM